MTKRLVPFLMMLILASCSQASQPSQEELATVQGMIEVYFTRTAQAAPPAEPTETPVPTPTRTLTPTPVPDPDPKAMILWQKLDLPQGFVSINPSSVGIGAGDVAYSRQLSTGAFHDYMIEGSFVFAEEWPVGIYGYTFLLPTDGDKQLFDINLPGLVQELQNLVTYGLEPDALSEPEVLADATGIGDNSRGAVIDYSKRGEEYRLYLVRFRAGGIGSNVFMRHRASENPLMDVVKLAGIYAQSVLYPEEGCQLVSIEPVEKETWPTFDILAEGFYPGEARSIALSGDVLINGESKSVTTALMGLDGQSANEMGRIEERVVFGIIEGANVQPPGEIEIEIRGWHSGCTVTEVVLWPGANVQSGSVGSSTPDRSAVLGEMGNPVVWALVPVANRNASVGALDQALDFVAAGTEHHLQAISLESEAQLIDRLCSGEAHIGALSAFGYLLAFERGCVEGNLAAVNFGDTVYRGQILVRRDGGITNVADFSGATFCRTSAESVSSWIVPRLMMHSVGIDPETDLQDIVDIPNAGDLVSAIYNGTCDAGSTYVDARTSVQGEHPDVMDLVQVLTETVPIPLQSLTFSSSLPAGLRDELAGMLVNLEGLAGGQVLSDLYGWEGIEDSSDSLYDALRELIAASGVELQSLVP
jgi:phosphonate transport system substrate-binding protein